MKRLISILYILFAVALVGCNDKYEVPSVEFSQGLSTSNVESGATFAVNRVVTFMDLSRSIESREWVLATGAEFLEGDASSQKIKVKFTGEGDAQTVTLNVKLSMPDAAIVAKNEELVAAGESHLVTDPQLYTEVYTFTVLGNVGVNILAVPVSEDAEGGFSVDDDETVFDTPGFTYDDYKITIMKGESITYKAVCVGIPNNFKWTLPGSDAPDGVISGDLTAAGMCQVSYPEVGVYDVTLEATRTSPASTGTRVLTAFVEVLDPADVDVPTTDIE